MKKILGSMFSALLFVRTDAMEVPQQGKQDADVVRLSATSTNEEIQNHPEGSRSTSKKKKHKRMQYRPTSYYFGRSSAESLNHKIAPSKMLQTIEKETSPEEAAKLMQDAAIRDLQLKVNLALKEKNWDEAEKALIEISTKYSTRSFEHNAIELTDEEAEYILDSKADNGHPRLHAFLVRVKGAEWLGKLQNMGKDGLLIEEETETLSFPEILSKTEKLLSFDEYKRELLRIMAYNNDAFDAFSAALQAYLSKHGQQSMNLHFSELPHHNYDFIERLQKAGFSFSEEDSIAFHKDKTIKGTPLPKEQFSFLIKIVEEDNLDELQKLINGGYIMPIIASFNEVERIRIPLIQYCIMKNAKKCFELLISSSTVDTTEPMTEFSKNPERSLHRYEWDSLATAIYFGRDDMIKLLEKKIEKGSSPAHLEAAILSYRNRIAEEIIAQTETRNEKLLDEVSKIGILNVAKNSNIALKDWEVRLLEKESNPEPDLYTSEVMKMLGEKSVPDYLKTSRELPWFTKEIISRIKEKNQGLLYTMLHAGILAATKSNNVRGGELLISKGANFSSRDNTGRTPWYIAIENNSKEMAELLTSKGIHLSDVNRLENRPENFDTLLHIALANNMYEITEILIRQGANINGKDEKGKTPLHIAVGKNLKDIGELLISQNAKIDATDNQGKTPLHYAAERDSKEMGELLLNKGADYNIKDDDGLTALHIAAAKNSKNIGEALIKKGWNVNALAEEPEEVEMRKMKEARYKMMERGWSSPEPFFLFDNHPFETYITGRTPLHLAAQNNSKEMAELLLINNANIEAEDKQNKTPLHYAAENDSQAVGELLISRGASADAKDNEGKTPRSYNREWIK